MMTQVTMQTAQVNYENNGIYLLSGPNPDTPGTLKDNE